MSFFKSTNGNDVLKHVMSDPLYLGIPTFALISIYVAFSLIKTGIHAPFILIPCSLGNDEQVVRL